jgi:hypothetical protein
MHVRGAHDLCSWICVTYNSVLRKGDYVKLPYTRTVRNLMGIGCTFPGKCVHIPTATQRTHQRRIVVYNKQTLAYKHLSVNLCMYRMQHKHPRRNIV